jgi:hypothetical protein
VVHPLATVVVGSGPGGDVVKPRQAVTQLVSAVWCHRGILSEGQIPEWSSILSKTDVPLTEALEAVARLDRQQLQCEIDVGGQRKPLADVLWAVMNMIAVYAGRSFAFVRDRAREKGLEAVFATYKGSQARLESALALLEPLMAADKALGGSEGLIMRKHLAALDSALHSLTSTGLVRYNTFPAIHRWVNERKRS